MILFLLPSIAHLADFRDIAQPRFFRGFPGTITRPGIARPTLIVGHCNGALHEGNNFDKENGHQFIHFHLIKFPFPHIDLCL